MNSCSHGWFNVLYTSGLKVNVTCKVCGNTTPIGMKGKCDFCRC